MKRRVSAFLLALILLNSCISDFYQAESKEIVSPNSNADSSHVTITFGASAVDRAYFEPLIEQFHAKNLDVRVIFIDLDQAISDPSNQVKSTVEAADTAFTYLTPKDISRNYVFNLKPFIDSDQSFDISDYYPRAFESISDDNQIYSVPVIASAPILAFNRSYVLEMGEQDLSESTTWTDLLNLSGELSQKQGSQTTMYGLMTGDLGFSALMATFEQTDIDPFTTFTEEGIINTPGIVVALENTHEMVEAGALWYPETGDNSSPEPVFIPNVVTDLVQKQQLAMWDANYAISTIDETDDFEVGYIPMPLLSLPYYLPGQLGYVISQGTLHPEAAWLWLSFLSKQPPPNIDNLLMSEVPARRSLAEQSNVFENKDSAFVTALKTGLEQSPINKPIMNDQLWFSVHDAWNQTISNILSAEEALNNAQEQMTQSIAESQNDSTQDIETIVVATPAIPPEDVRVIRFGTSMDQQIAPVLTRFTRNHPDIQVELIPADMSIGADVVPDFLQMANQTDCFTWPTSLPGNVLTATLNLDPFMDADSTFNTQDYPQALFTPFERENSMHGFHGIFSYRH